MKLPGAGYVAGRDRIEPDVTAIVAPVRYAGGVAAALSVLGPTYRIDKATMHRYGRDRRRRGGALSASSAPPSRRPERRPPA